MPTALNDKHPITALEIDDNFLKLSQLKEKKGKKSLSLFLRKSSQDKDITSHLKELIKESGLSVSSIVVAIPREQLIVRFLKLPSTDETEIAQMLRFQLKTHIPYPEEEIVADYIVFNTLTQGYSLIMLVAASKEIIYKYIKYLEDLNLKPCAVTLSSQGILNYYNYATDKDTAKQPILLIDIDSNYAEVMLIQNRELLFTRSISIPDKELFLNELGRTIQGIQKEGIYENISKLVLTGATDLFEDLLNTLKDRFSFPVETLDLTKDLCLKTSGSYDMCKPDNVSVSSVIGISLSKSQALINLLPADIRNKWEIKAQKIQLLQAISTIAAISICLASVFIKEGLEKKEYNGYLEAEIEKTQAQAERIQNMAARLEFIKYEVKQRTLLYDIIGALYTITPLNAHLIDFTYDEGDKITIRGDAKAMNDVFEFSNLLEQLPYFKGVKIKQVTEKRLQQKYIGLNFELICQL